MSQSRILIVDDEDSILQGYATVLGPAPVPPHADGETAHVLSRLSADLFGDSAAAPPPNPFDLCLCHQATEAIKAVERAMLEQRPFAVAFVDIRLPPGIDGIALAECLRALDPLLNIVIVTGYADLRPAEIRKRLTPPDKFLYCQKPLHAAELLQLAYAMSAKWRTEHDLITSQNRMEQLLNASNVVLYSCLPGGFRDRAPIEITFVSDNVRAVFGFDPEDYLGTPQFLQAHIHPDDLCKRQQAVDTLAVRDGPMSIDTVYRFRASGGDYRWISDRVKVIRDHNQQASEYLGCWIDVTDRKRDEERIRYLAYHDSLTGLSNRALMNMVLDRDLIHAARHRRRLAVLTLDLDHFKKVNDSLGHAAGDQLLQEAARRISSVVRSNEIVARDIDHDLDNLPVCRLGGDEFVIILGDLDSPVDAAMVARRIRETLTMPFQITGSEDPISISASVGIGLFPDDGQDAASLLKCSDAAMYTSKELGRNRISYFTRSLGERADRRLSIETKLLKSFDNGENGYPLPSPNVG